MKKKAIWFSGVLFLCIAAAGIRPLQAQMAPKAKPPVYTYVATWDVPRAPMARDGKT